MEREEEGGRRRDGSVGGAVCGEVIGFLYDEDDPTVDEEKLAEAMRRLEDEISLPSRSSPTPAATSGSVSGPALPRRSLPQDGVESCGSVFSDSASTVMASIDVSGVSSAALVGAAAATTTTEVEVGEEEEEEEEEELVMVDWEECMTGVLGDGEMQNRDGGGSV